MTIVQLLMVITQIDQLVWPLRVCGLPNPFPRASYDEREHTVRCAMRERSAVRQLAARVLVAARGA